MGPWMPQNDPNTIPIRARAYNDCVQHHVLPKTRSSGGPGYPRFERVLGSTDGTPDTPYMLSEYSVHVQIHTIIYPQNGGPHFGVYRWHTRSWFQVPISGFRVFWRWDLGWLVGWWISSRVDVSVYRLWRDIGYDWAHMYTCAQVYTGGVSCRLLFISCGNLFWSRWW